MMEKLAKCGELSAKRQNCEEPPFLPSSLPPPSTAQEEGDEGKKGRLDQGFFVALEALPVDAMALQSYILDMNISDLNNE